MAQDFTTTALLSSIRRRAMLPATDETLSNTDLLAIATEELQTEILELWLTVREESAVRDYDVPIQSGTASYPLPPRGAFETVRQVLVLGGSTYEPLQRLEPEHVHEYSSTSGSPDGFYFQDDKIVLVPTPSSSGTLRVQFHRRPSALVATSAAAVVSSVASNVITTSSSIPSTFTTGILVDIVDKDPGFRILTQDATTQATTSGTTVTLTSAPSSSVAAGDYICLAGESCVPQIPVELHPLLAQRTAAKALEALGDAKADRALKVYGEMRERAINMLSPRSAGSPRFLVNRNGPGFGRVLRRRR